MHRNKRDGDIHKGKWNGLGGKFDTGESPEQCIIREVEEESGLLISTPKLHGFITFPQFKDNQDWYVFVYTADQFEGTLIDCNEGELEWINDQQLSSLNLWEGDHIFLKWIYQNKPFFTAIFNYQNKELQSHSVVFHKSAN